MRIDKIYRLIYVCEDSESCESKFFTNKKGALDYLEDMKDEVGKLYEDNDNGSHPFGGAIVLQEIVLDEVEDIDLYAESKDVSEWVFDEDYTMCYQKDMANAGIYTEELWGMWKDYEVE